ncbi:uncharacterized protein LOC116780724 [Chiroxiphia lanceolata]|uniref:uncharacterized protein LOC116780724 n=1 Tax=Chiroxiphia lanceolata TaxID=296741 RepID=UPI0013CE86F4|nr:uncharacterized protein LOC116780724 [Chiroxiphia lanceolata]
MTPPRPELSRDHTKDGGPGPEVRPEATLKMAPPGRQLSRGHTKDGAAPPVLPVPLRSRSRSRPRPRLRPARSRRALEMLSGLRRRLPPSGSDPRRQIRRRSSLGVTKLMEKKTKGLEAPSFPSVAVGVPDASGRTNPVAFLSNVLCACRIATRGNTSEGLPSR